MNDSFQPHADIRGLDRFTAELGDALVAYAEALPRPERTRPAPRRMPRSARRLIAASAVLAVAIVAVMAGALGRHAGSPPPASAATVLRTAAAALGHAPGGPLPPGDVWHTRVIVTMREPGDGYLYVTTTRWDIRQSRSGAGRQRVVTVGPARFPAAADRARWRADASPRLADPSVGDQALPATPRPFRFGTGELSYRQLQRLPTDPSALAALLERIAGQQRRVIPRSFDRRQARAYVLFTLIRDALEAPTSAALRAALYELLARTPGLHLDGPATDHAGRSGTAVSVTLGDARFVLVVNPATGSVLETRRILLRAGPQFPGPPGLISRATFLAARAVRR